MQIIGTKRIVDKDGCVDVLLYMQDNIYSIKYTVDDYSRHTVFNFSKEVSKTEAQRLYGALSIQMPFMQAFCKKRRAM